MAVLLSGADGYAQFITVLVVFVLVLLVTAYVTKWIANYQKHQSIDRNIEVIETTRLDNNKWIQIVRVGNTYKVLAVCKDTVTLLGEVPKEELREAEPGGEGISFKELFDKAVKKDLGNQKEPRDKDT
ncbi:MAG: flagellar biosynthetic protein FliO [Bacteroidales bacterium]|nr:flagellar biosynthetic protein FliO [Lachnoclostridium sp.]MCM1385034.1 flagellar biosynthetic protein FliO [Lachnoclostridium sp.]MCM1465334.1 flagellar biosynthetic protein FliO [Bacteroidales bacterium]